MLTELLTPAPPIRSDYPDDKSYHQGWLDWRRTGIGASEAAKVARVAPKSYGSLLKLQWDKLGMSEHEPPNISMRRGTILEPLICQLFEERYDETFAGEQVLIRHPEYPFMLASLDRVRSNGRLVEAKSMLGHVASYYGLGQDGDAESLPMHFRVQGMHQMACYGTDLVTFAILVDDDFRCYDLERDDDAIASLIEVEATFWDRHILQQIPVKDYAASDADMIGKRYREETGEHCNWTDSVGDMLHAAMAYESLTDVISGLEKQKTEAENDRKAIKAQILEALGNATSASLPMGYEITRKIINRRGHSVKPSSYPQISVRKSS